MNIIEQNREKINGILETFDRMIINGYLLNLCNYRYFLFYLIESNIKLDDFDKFALKETQKLEVTSRPTKCKHYYFYYNDDEFGLMYLKVKTWFPYNVQIYINGREYLSKLLDKNNIKYEMYNNSFSYIEDFTRTQELADGILNQKISDSFDGLIKQINIHLPKIEKIFSHSYYWCIDQCEFATNINFKNRDDLRHRYQGYRIKFKINNNQIKMYDKRNNLRIEVTINNPKDFKVLKEKEKIWVPMGKSISNLYRYVEISKSITKKRH